MPTASLGLPTSATGASLIRIVGLPASGKTWLRERLADCLGVPAFGIDDERLALTTPGRTYWYGRDPIAWDRLARKIGEHPAAILESSGTRDVALLAGHNVLSIACVAPAATRGARLEERQASGYPFARGRRDYVQRLLEGVAVQAELTVDTTDARSVEAALAACQRFLATTGRT